MNIIIFGATGRTGTVLPGEALRQGHQVTAFVLQASRVTLRHRDLRVVEGSLKNLDLLRTVMKTKIKTN